MGHYTSTRSLGDNALIAAISTMSALKCIWCPCSASILSLCCRFVRDKRLHKYYLSGTDAFRLKLWLK